MIRLSFRQFRAQAIVGVTGLALGAVVLVISGVHLVHLYDTTVVGCRAHGDCPAATTAVTNSYPAIQMAAFALELLVPALIGIFWGAPLIARELETGTFRLAWTQSVTRRRWVATKLAFVGAASMVVGGLLSLMVTWWESPLDAVTQNRFSPAMFGLRGIVPIGYAAFAFALGVTFGVLVRRTIPAMALTLVGYVGARLLVTYEVRSRFEAPVRAVQALSSSNDFAISNTPQGPQLAMSSATIPNAWVSSVSLADHAGRAPATNFIQTSCPQLYQHLVQIPPPGGGVGRHSAVPANAVMQPLIQTCLQKATALFHLVVVYQPADRYWPFQWMELGLFVAAAVALCSLTTWWVRRHLA